MYLPNYCYIDYTICIYITIKRALFLITTINSWIILHIFYDIICNKNVIIIAFSGTLPIITYISIVTETSTHSLVSIF